MSSGHVDSVVKRNGKKEPVDFNKIQQRIESLCWDLDTEFVNVTKVTQNVISGIYDGVLTTELDELAIRVAGAMNAEHHHYGRLAGRLAASNLQKMCPNSFSECTEALHGSINNNKVIPVVAEDYYEFVKENAVVLDAMIDKTRDFDYDVFAVHTLMRSYLLKASGVIVETPQYLQMRVAVALNMVRGLDAIKETYDALSTKRYTHATPCLFNAGTTLPQLASCFLLRNKGDSIEGIFESVSDCAKISRTAGGIGLSFHDIRSNGSFIAGTNGKSSGIVPMLKIFEATALAVDQASKRKGSFAIYLSPWHADIEDFVQLRLNHGAEERRTRDLFIALWCNDLFFERVRAGEDWSLFDPNTAPGLHEVFGDEHRELYERYEREGRAVKVLPAQRLWNMIYVSNAETGTPYLLNADQINRCNNQKALGTIQSSNLCAGKFFVCLLNRLT